MEQRRGVKHGCYSLHRGKNGVAVPDISNEDVYVVWFRYGRLPAEDAHPPAEREQGSNEDRSQRTGRARHERVSGPGAGCLGAMKRGTDR